MKIIFWEMIAIAILVIGVVITIWTLNGCADDCGGNHQPVAVIEVVQ